MSNIKFYQYVYFTKSNNAHFGVWLIADAIWYLMLLFSLTCNAFEQCLWIAMVSSNPSAFDTSALHHESFKELYEKMNRIQGSLK